MKKFKDFIKKYICNKKIMCLFILSLLFPALVVITRPFDMSLTQSMVTAILLLVIIWWSSGLTTKTFASLFLLIGFSLIGSVSFKTVFSFAYSNTFFLIVFCYLLTKGITKSGVVEKMITPILSRVVTTPIKAILIMVIVLFLSIYIIPQPLVRLIIISEIFKDYFDKTNITFELKQVLLFAVFVLYCIVNMTMLDADIILNSSAVGFAQLSLTNTEWMYYMFVPTLFYIVLIVTVFYMTFRKDMRKVKILCDKPKDSSDAEKTPLTTEQKRVCIIVGCTIVLWIISNLLSMDATLIVIAATLIMFALRLLTLSDIKAIDINTIVFLTASFSIGGVMRESGVADVLFTRVAMIFPTTYSIKYLLTIIVITMVMHLILGSNTSTLSVVLSGLMFVCTGVLPAKIVFFIVYICLPCHYLLPFHSVAMMIGVGNKSFTSKHITKFGTVIMPFTILAILLLYIPWWKLVGFM